MDITKHFIVFFISLCCVGVNCKRGFDIVCTDITAEANEEYVNITHVTSKLGTVEATLNGTYEILKETPIDLEMELRIEREVYGKYVTAGMPLKKSVCDYVKNDKAFYPSLVKYGVNMPRTCPLKKGYIFKLVNFNLNQFDLPMSILPNGDYRVTIKMLLPGKPSTILLYARIQSAT